ncbi:uncharacterized protein LOC121071381 [Cygnus olor]|uniref:uncharacterized protein LOC121071381 n=1 Tax=Cygnus olor TaxID=8869 RepID=UPI001ADE1208|nr:uncharacterized protein LOC121071381 [Cygnus olor]
MTRDAKTSIQGLTPGRQVEGARDAATASLPQLRLRGLEGKKGPTWGQPTPGGALYPAKGPFWGGCEHRFTPLPPSEAAKWRGSPRLSPRPPPLSAAAARLSSPRCGYPPPKISRERRAVREGAAFPSTSGRDERVKSDEDAPPAGQSAQVGRARGLQGPERFPCKKIEFFFGATRYAGPRVQALPANCLVRLPLSLVQSIATLEKSATLHQVR